MRPRLRGALVAAALSLTAVPARADTGEAIVIESPRSGSRAQGEPAVVPLVVGRAQPWAMAVRVEVDGELGRPLLPWPRRSTLELEPGLRRVAVVGVDARSGAPLRSEAVKIAVFREPERHLGPRGRNALVTAVAFVVAVGGAAGLRRRGAA
ncbi:hypothetical protein G6O69_19950 [Pseudenhygromyxa sp. WMMC2535]|uniref:hypothetical protein n=1 Tax=Pseudenhygromyxa sp. WMMC2535 TaxID=2712867 RepID=UPI0015573757|nr:hypothetical protein [Pseudenhygromyxa sp. WMMC2535]NVB40130.1 hypothetical protein [Pseudenhygromyxa sp. WMMC2535]